MCAEMTEFNTVIWHFLRNSLYFLHVMFMTITVRALFNISLIWYPSSNVADIINILMNATV